jgi:hypothetical protein
MRFLDFQLAILSFRCTIELRLPHTQSASCKSFSIARNSNGNVTFLHRKTVLNLKHFFFLRRICFFRYSVLFHLIFLNDNYLRTFLVNGQQAPHFFFKRVTSTSNQQTSNSKSKFKFEKISFELQ